MLSVVEVVLVALALWQILDTWFEGSIFENARADFEVHRTTWVRELVSCRFCLTHWVALFTVGAYWGSKIVFPLVIPNYVEDGGIKAVLGFSIASACIGIKVIVHAFAITKLAHLGHEWRTKAKEPENLFSDNLENNSEEITENDTRSGGQTTEHAHATIAKEVTFPNYQPTSEDKKSPPIFDVGYAAKPHAQP